MNTKRLNTNIISHLKHYRTVNAHWLRTFAETPFRRAPTAYPRHVRNHFRMLCQHFQMINLSRFYIFGYINCESGSSANESPQIFTVQCYRCIRSNAFEAQKVLFSISCIRSSKSIGIGSGTVQISMCKLAIAEIIVPIVRYIYF